MRFLKEKHGREMKENKIFKRDNAKAKCSFETDPNDRNSNTFNLAKDTLDFFYEEKIKGIIVCARARWHEIF